MTRTVTATCNISFAVGETFDGPQTITLAYAGEELVVVSDNGNSLTVRKSGSNETFEVQKGQYQ